MPKKKKAIPASQLALQPQIIERHIYLIRGQKVMLDFELAHLYGVSTGNLNLAVRRNKNRFPEDFMFRLTSEESKSLLLQIASAKGRGGRRTPPYAFTEQGVAMLSSVLKSERAALVNIAIMRAFVRMRQVLEANKDLARKVKALHRGLAEHDAKIKAIFDAIRELMKPPPDMPKRSIGFSGRKKHKSKG